MQSLDDGTLLRQFAASRSDTAFAELVARHVNLVYSVARRQVGDPHHAEEITQAVFIILARKAGEIRNARAVSSWLFQTTRLTAQNFRRQEARRHQREQEAHMQSTLNEAGNDAWPQIAPLLDDAVAALREQDRRAIMLRFYEGRELREVGLALGASEAAAEKRVSRALDKLRKIFTKRGATFSVAAIASAVAANSVQAAPVGLAKTATAVALAKGAAASISTLTLTKATLIAMKTKTIVATAVTAAILLGAAAYFAYHKPAVSRVAAAHVTLPILLANADSHRDANDPLFEIGLDPDVRRTSNSAPAIHIKGPITPNTPLTPNFSDAAQQKAGNSSAAACLVTKGSPLMGKRIRVTGWIKSSNVQSWAAAYMCIWSQDHGFCRVDTMDDSDDRHVLHGTQDWQQVEFVTDVPNEPCVIFTGPDLYGPGELWGDDFQIALAPPDADITDDRNWRHTSATPNTYTETDDYVTTHDGHHTVCLAYTANAPQRGSWMWWGQKLRGPDFEKYKGHTMRMSGWVKTENVTGYLEPIIRPWAKNGKYGRDSMSGDKSLTGTLGWTQFTVTSAIGKETTHVDTPFILWGSGKAWIDMESLKFEVVK